MSERIIYADRPFRDEFIEEIHTIAPGYIFKTELQPEDLQLRLPRKTISLFYLEMGPIYLSWC